MAGVDVGTAYLTVVPSARGFASKLQSELGGGFGDAGKKAGSDASRGFGSSFSSGLKSVVAPAAALLGGLGAASFLKDSVGEAREAQKVGALTENVIKSTGGAAKISAKQVGDLSTAISNKTGIDDEAIQSGANLLLTFKNVKNEVGAGANIFDRATAAATDLSAAGFGDMSATSKQLGKALNDPIAGISALSRSGVTFTEQQKTQIKALVETGKTLEAQKIILGEVESQVGGAAAASSTAGEKMKVAFGNVKEQLGTALLPVVDKFATTMTGKVLPAITGVIGILSEGAFNGDMGFEEDSGFVSFLFNVREGAIALFGVLKNNDADLDTSLLSPVEKFGVFLLKAKGIAKTVFTQIIAGAQGMFAAFSGEGATSDGFVGFMENVGVAARAVFDYLKEALPPIWDAAQKLWPSIKEIGKQLLAASANSGISTFGLFKDVLAALPGILNAILPMVENLAKWMGENAEFVGALVAALSAGIVAFKVISGVVKAFTILQGVLNVVLAANPIGLIIIAIAALVAGLIYAYNNSETFRDIVDGVWEKVRTVISFAWENVIKPVLGFLVQYVKDAWESFNTLKDTVSTAWDNIKSAASTGVAAVVQFFLNMADGILTAADSAFGWIPGIGDKLHEAKGKFDTFRDQVNASLGGIQRTIDVDVNLAVTGNVDGVIAGIAARAGRNASGTPSWRGGLTWVGEQGPELISLPKGTEILNNRESMDLAQPQVFQPSTSGGSGSAGTLVEQHFHGPIVTPNYREFEREKLEQARRAGLGRRGAVVRA